MSGNGPFSYPIDRDKLVEENRAFVISIAVQMSARLPRHIEIDELIACGNLGLVEAAQRYDPHYRNSFRTFAFYRIRGAMYDALRNMAPLSRGDYRRSHFASNANDLLQTVGDDTQSSFEAASQSLDDEIADAQVAIDALIPAYLLSLESDRLCSYSDETNPLSRIEHEELANLTRALVRQLPDDDRIVIEGLYFKDQPIGRIGAELGVSKSWASRLHVRAIRRLRELMERQGLLDSR